MKTTIITLFTALTLVTGIAAAKTIAPVKNETAVVLHNITAINKIEVHGNVEVYISDGAKDEVKVYNKYYAESALVQNTDGVLRITSYKAEKLVVWVTAADLRTVSAFDNAEVKSFGDLSKIEFNVDLHNTANVNLHLDAYSANISLSDNATAELSGKATEFNITRNLTTTLFAKNFAATHFNENTAGLSVEDNLAGL